ncbi:MAG: hypothetical protein H6719_37795 [Sandaracinaceae bacterium]|nr:hypothetical protein [Sandaracinaceae bacterium]
MDDLPLLARRFCELARESTALAASLAHDHEVEALMTIAQRTEEVNAALAEAEAALASFLPARLEELRAIFLGEGFPAADVEEELLFLSGDEGALARRLGLDPNLQARRHEAQMQIIGNLRQGGHAGVPTHHYDEDGSYLGFW